MKYSKQREHILKTLRENVIHPTADEIYALARKGMPSLSLATVYRNLNQLAESGEIRKLEIPGGPERFDHRLHDHYHVRCLKCGRVFDVDMPYQISLSQALRDSRGFLIEEHDIVFKGLCPGCRET